MFEEEQTPPINAQSFEEVARPLMKWLAENGPKNAGAIVTSTHAEVVDSLHIFKTDDYLKEAP